LKFDILVVVFLYITLRLYECGTCNTCNYPGPVLRCPPCNFNYCSRCRLNLKIHQLLFIVKTEQNSIGFISNCRFPNVLHDQTNIKFEGLDLESLKQIAPKLDCSLRPLVRIDLACMKNYFFPFVMTF